MLCILDDDEEDIIVLARTKASSHNVDVRCVGCLTAALEWWRDLRVVGGGFGLSLGKREVEESEGLP